MAIAATGTSQTRDARLLRNRVDRQNLVARAEDDSLDLKRRRDTQS
jgi:hypothetical protein